MALIICSECGKEFSDKAGSCPNCGCPTDVMINNSSKETDFEDKDNKVCCPECNHEVTADTDTCPECGFPLKTNDDTITQKVKMVSGLFFITAEVDPFLHFGF